MGAEAARALEGAETERLLASSAALRRLALRLAPDASAADDLLQDAWVAALTARSAPRDGWLPWMKGALRLRGRERQRGELRRRGRERVAARPEALPDATDALARLELHEILLRELRALPEPYRRALIERWLEERSVADIAARTGAPVRTVDTRLARGLVLLRARIERVARGDDPRWLAGLVAFFQDPRTAWLLMSIEKRIAAVALLLLTATTATWLVRPSSARSVVPAAGDAEHVDEVVDLGPALEQDAAEGAASEPRRAVVLEAPRVEPARGRTASLSGRVVDASGAPVRGARVWALASRPHGSRSADFATPPFGAPLAGGTAEGAWTSAAVATADADGRFALFDLRPGAIDLAVRAAGFAPHDARFLGLPRDGRDLGSIALAPGTRLSGMVVDAQGRGVSSARVSLRGAYAPSPRAPAAAWLPAATSAADGSFAILDAPPGAFALQAESPSHAPAGVSSACAASACDGLRIVLPDGARLAGRVVGEGDGAWRVVALARAARTPFGPRRVVRTAEVGIDGRFELAGLPDAAAWELDLHRDEDGEAGPSLGGVGVEPGVLDATLERPPRVVVRVRAEDEATGEPVEVDAVVLTALEARGTQSTRRLERSGADGSDSVWSGFGFRAATLAPNTVPPSATLSAAGYDDLLVRLADAAPSGELDLGSLALRRSRTLEVQVIDGTGHAPVRGAVVETSRVARSLSGLGYVDVVPADRTAHRAPSSARAETDATGRATLRAGTSDALRCTVTADGFAPWEREIGGDERVVEVALTRPVELRVRVLAGGAADALRVVRLVRRGASERGAPEGGETHASTDAHGIARFDVAPLTEYTVSMPLAGAPWADRERIDVAVGPDGEEVVLELAPATWLEGRVLRHGRPVAGVRVRGRAHEGEPAPDGAGIAGASTTDALGRYRLDDLSPSGLELVVEDDATALTMDWSIDVATGANSADIDVTPAELTGRLVDERGEPAGGISLALLAPPEPASAFTAPEPRHAGTTLTEADGTFRFPGVPHGTALRLAVSEGSHVLDEHALELAPLESRDLGTVTAVRAATVRISIAADATSELASVRVALATEEHQRTGIATPDHPLELRGLPPGRWTLVLRRNFERKPFLTEPDVVLEPGATLERVLRAP